MLPITSPKNNVATLMISFSAERVSRGTTPDSRSRFPTISAAINGAAFGTKTPTAIVTPTGNTTSANCDTGRGAYTIFVARSSRVVINRIIGGWMIGTRLIYEYATTEITPSRCGANWFAT